MRVNLKSAFLGCKNVIPVMMKGGGGTIINMGSVSGLEAGPVSQTAYEVSKGRDHCSNQIGRAGLCLKQHQSELHMSRWNRDAPSQKIHGGLYGLLMKGRLGWESCQWRGSLSLRKSLPLPRFWPRMRLLCDWCKYCSGRRADRRHKETQLVEHVELSSSSLRYERRELRT